MYCTHNINHAGERHGCDGCCKQTDDRTISDITARDDELERARGEHMSDRNRFQNVLCNLYAIATDETCKPEISIGMSTSAVRRLRTERDDARDEVTRLTRTVDRKDEQMAELQDHAQKVERERDELRVADARLDAAIAQRDRRIADLEAALRFQDPRNASARYDRIADDFHRETGLWPPGRDAPAAMGLPESLREEAQAKWRPFVDAWHERWFDAALSAPASSSPILSTATTPLPGVSDAAQPAKRLHAAACPRQSEEHEGHCFASAQPATATKCNECQGAGRIYSVISGRYLPCVTCTFAAPPSPAAREAGTTIQFRRGFCPKCNREITESELAHVRESNRRWDHEVDCLGYVKERVPDDRYDASNVISSNRDNDRVEQVIVSARRVMELLGTRDGQSFMHRDAALHGHWKELRADLAALDAAREGK
jgi:hypothetical protein